LVRPRHRFAGRGQRVLGVGAADDHGDRRHSRHSLNRRRRGDGNGVVAAWAAGPPTVTLIDPRHGGVMKSSYKIALLLAAGLLVFVLGYYATQDDPAG